MGRVYRMRTCFISRWMGWDGMGWGRFGVQVLNIPHKVFYRSNLARGFRGDDELGQVGGSTPRPLLTLGDDT